MNKTTIGIAMGTAALGMAIGYLSSQGRSTVACSPTAPLYQHVTESPAKDVVQQEAPAKDEGAVASGPINFGQAVPPVAEVKHVATVTLTNGKVLTGPHGHCAWIHKTQSGMWLALPIPAPSGTEFMPFKAPEQAEAYAMGRWCGK